MNDELGNQFLDDNDDYYLPDRPTEQKEPLVTRFFASLSHVAFMDNRDPHPYKKCNISFDLHMRMATPDMFSATAETESQRIERVAEEIKQAFIQQSKTVGFEKKEEARYEFN